MEWIDTHTHLHFPDYDNDREAVIYRAREAGIAYLINVGTDVANSEAALALSRQHDFIYATVGIHPHDACEAKETDFQTLELLLLDPKVVAIGEVGLDYYRNLSPPEVQLAVLCRFLTLYRKTNKPLILHCRDAYEELLEILHAEFKERIRGVLHCFSSDRTTMEKFLDLGFYISFSGSLTYKKNDSLRDACRFCPQDRLLLETDAPFLTPQAMRGKRNESGFLVETAKVCAEVRHQSLESLAEITTANAKSLFNL